MAEKRTTLIVKTPGGDLLISPNGHTVLRQPRRRHLPAGMKAANSPKEINPAAQKPAPAGARAPLPGIAAADRAKAQQRAALTSEKAAQLRRELGTIKAQLDQLNKAHSQALGQISAIGQRMQELTRREMEIKRLLGAA